MFRILPPPPSGTNIFIRLDGSCTRLAANAGKAFVMQWIVRDRPFPDLFFYLFICKESQGG